MENKMDQKDFKQPSKIKLEKKEQITLKFRMEMNQIKISHKTEKINCKIVINKQHNPTNYFQSNSVFIHNKECFVFCLSKLL
jgi:hypothetical protein